MALITALLTASCTAAAFRYDSPQAAAEDYARGLLEGDVALCNRSAGGNWMESQLDDARSSRLGIESTQTVASLTVTRQTETGQGDVVTIDLAVELEDGTWVPRFSVMVEPDDERGWRVIGLTTFEL